MRFTYLDSNSPSAKNSLQKNNLKYRGNIGEKIERRMELSTVLSV